MTYMKNIRQLVELSQKIFEPLQPITKIIKQLSVSSPLGPYAKYFEQHRDIVDRIRKLHNWDECISKRVERLAKCGWYLSGELVSEDELLDKFLEEAEGGRDRNLIEFMVAALRAAKDNIESNTLGKFPARKEYLDVAFSLHWSGNYAAAIPLLLIQSDGIAYDRLGHLENRFQLFGIEKGLPKFKGILEKAKEESLVDSYADKYMSSLGITTMLHGNGVEAIRSGNHFNRNAIMHGISTSYANELNSYRAYSLLSMLASWLS